MIVQQFILIGMDNLDLHDARFERKFVVYDEAGAIFKSSKKCLKYSLPDLSCLQMRLSADRKGLIDNITKKTKILVRNIPKPKSLFFVSQNATKHQYVSKIFTHFHQDEMI